MPITPIPTAPGSRADATPTDHELYAAATGAGLSADAASALIHARRGQQSPRQLWDAASNGGVDDDTATKLTQYATGVVPPAPADPNAPPIPGAAGSFGDHSINGASMQFLPKMDAAAHAAVDPITNAYTSAPRGQKIAAAIQALSSPSPDTFGSRYDARLAADRDYLQRETTAHPVASIAGEITGAIASPVNKIAAPLGAIGGGAAIGATAALGGDDSGDLVHKATAATTGGLFGGAVGGIAGAAANRFLGGGPDNAAALLAPHVAAAGDVAPALAPNGVLADALPQLARTVRSASPKAGAAIDASLLARRATQAPTIQDALESALGVPRNSATTATKAIIDARAAAAKPLYDAAYQSADVSSPAIADALKLPQFAKAYSEGQRLAALEGSPIPDAGADGSMSVRALDYMKRGLNNVIETGTRGATMARSEARLLTSKLNGILGIADQQAPAYALARQSFAGHTALADAAEAGGNFMNGATTAEDVSHALSTLSPSEAATYRQTAANALLAKIESARGSATGKADLLAKVYDSIGGRAKLRALFPTPEAATRFENAADRLATQNATYSTVTGGSNTTDKLTALAQFSDATTPASTLAKLLRSIAHPAQTLANGADAYAAKGVAAKVGAQADQLAPMLVDMSPAGVLQRIAQETARVAKVRGVAGFAGRNVAGAIGAPRVASLVDSLLYGSGRPGDVR